MDSSILAVSPLSELRKMEDDAVPLKLFADDAAAAVDAAAAAPVAAAAASDHSEHKSLQSMHDPPIPAQEGGKLKLEPLDTTDAHDTPASEDPSSSSSGPSAPAVAASVTPRSSHSTPSSPPKSPSAAGAASSVAAAAAPAAAPADAAAAFPLDSLSADPAARRIHRCYQFSAKFQRRSLHNLKLLTQLVATHSEQNLVAAVKLEQEERQEEKEPETAASAAVKLEKTADSFPIATPARARTRSAHAAQPAAAAAAAAADSSSFGAPPAARHARMHPSAFDLRRIARKKKKLHERLAHTRPSSCPPVFHHEAERSGLDALPQWIKDIATPRPKQETQETETKGAAATALATTFPLSSSIEHVDVMATPMRKAAAADSGVSSPAWPGLTRPNMVRSATTIAAHPISWLTTASAPSTPAGASSYREMALSHPAMMMTTSPAASPVASGGETVLAGGGSGAQFVVPALPRGGSLFSPLLASTSVATRPAAVDSSEPGGSRPTPLLLPSTSITAASSMSPMIRPLSGVASRGSTGSFAAAGASSAAPLFGDSKMETSIESSAMAVPPPSSESVMAVAHAVALQQRSISIMSPVRGPSHPHTPMVSASWPTHHLPPTSPMMRHTSTGGGALVHEWRSLAANFVESVLRPPTIASLADGSRLPVQMHAKALSEFASKAAPPLSATAPSLRHTPAGTPSHHAAAAAAGSMPPPMSPLPARRISIGLPPAFYPMSPMTGMLRSVSEHTPQQQVPQPPLQRTLTHSAVASGSTISAGLPPIPMSPNVSRMASYPHTPISSHTPGGSKSMATGLAHLQRQHTPMSPLGLAQPAPGSAVAATQHMDEIPTMPSLSRQATTVSMSATTTDGAVAAVAPPTDATIADPAAVVAVVTPVAPVGAYPHTVSRVGVDYQAEPPLMLTQKQREWEKAVYLRAHAAVFGFPKHLPPMPSQEQPPPTPSLTHQQSSASNVGTVGVTAASASSMPHQPAAPSQLVYVPIPRGFPPPYSLPAFPASASLALTSKRTALRAALMGGRKAARRKAQLEAEAGIGSRDARKRLRDEKRADPHTRDDDDARPANPRFAHLLSLFPAGSPKALMHFDDDTLSPHFVCSAFVRPGSPLNDPRQRPSSPVHVLSMPPTPSTTSGHGDLSRFPSSLLEPSMFSRRMAALEKANAAGLAGMNDEEVDLYEEQAEMEQEHKQREKSARARRPRQLPGESVQGSEADAPTPTAKSKTAGRTTPAVSHGARVAPGSGGLKSSVAAAAATSGSKRKSAASPNPASTPSSAVVVLHASNPAITGRYRRWKMVNKLRVVSWVDEHGNPIEGDVSHIPLMNEEKKKATPAGMAPPLSARQQAAANKEAAAVAAAAAAAAAVAASSGDDVSEAYSESSAPPIRSSRKPSKPSSRRQVFPSASQQQQSRTHAESESELDGDTAADDESKQGGETDESDAHSSIHYKRARLDPDPGSPVYKLAPAEASAKRAARFAARNGAAAAAAASSSSAVTSGVAPPVLRQSLSDLSPSVRVGAARSGVSRILGAIDSVLAHHEEFDDIMEHAIQEWNDTQ